jgi:nucleoid DNA-binding protein
MNSIDLSKKVANSNNIPVSRAEMIVSIIFERIKETLKAEGEVTIPGFGKFYIISKNPDFSNVKQTSIFARNFIAFQPDNLFLDKVNAQS